MLAEFTKMPKEGDTIGHYIIQKMLSTSILGSFFQATSTQINKDVLVHIIPEALMRADSRFIKRYKQVIEEQKQMSGGAAMSAVELHRIGGNLLVQYPVGNYKSLSEIVLKRGEPYSEEQVQDLLSKIAKGLMLARKIEQGHYFLTPDFLFLDEHGELRIAGIGLFQSIQYECFERFVSGAVIPVAFDKSKNFTALEILSPEIRNFKARDLRSDFYCIGMCAYFLLTGEKPTRRWAAPTEARKELGEGWDIFISTCLEPKPADRYANYHAFIKDLDNVTELAEIAKKQAKPKKRLRFSRMHLPHWLERHFDLRGLAMMRLVMLGIAGILAVGTMAMLSFIIFSDYGEAESAEPIKRLFSEDGANFIIRVSPPNALVEVRGRQSGRFSPRGTTLYLQGGRGQYSVQVSAPYHRPVSRTYEISGSQPVSANIFLQPDFATVRINGAVGTEVYDLSETGLLLHVGTIESVDGLVVDDRILTGRHQLVGLHKSLYPAIADEILMERNAVEISFKQVPKPTELIVTSSPEGATVILQGTEIGLTPLKVQELVVGRPLELSLQKDGYRTVERELLFDLGERIEIDAGELELKIGTLSYELELDMPNPPDMREFMFTLDGEVHVLDSSGSFQLPEGIHQVKLQHPDYFPFEEDIEVLDREESRVVLSLQPRPVRINPLIDTEAPSIFFVDGQVTPLTEQGILNIPANRRIEVQVMIRDFLTVRQSFQGTPNERIEWDIPLKPIPGPVPGEDWSPPYVELDMAWLPPGQFEMGSPVREFRRIPNEDSLTRVSLSSGFWIGVNEISQASYRRIMGENPSEFQNPDFPVDSVSWEDAVEFCRRLTQTERAAGRLPDGWLYRLPTEAEWEYAARAGTTTPFSFGESASSDDGNFHGLYQPGTMSGDEAEEHYGTMRSGSFEPNAFGLYDVHGNVAEWTTDRYWDRHPGGSETDPVNLERGRGYTIKGGSWEDTADRVRSAAREGAPGSSVRNSLGFRIVLAPQLRSANQ